MPKRLQSLHRCPWLRSPKSRRGVDLRNPCSAPSWDSCARWSVPGCWYRSPRTCRRSDSCASNRFLATRTPESRRRPQNATKSRGRRTGDDSIRAAAAGVELLESSGSGLSIAGDMQVFVSDGTHDDAGAVVSSRYSTPCFPPPISRVVPGISTGPELPRSRSLTSSPLVPGSSQLAGRNHPVNLSPSAGFNWIRDSFASNN